MSDAGKIELPDSTITQSDWDESAARFGELDSSLEKALAALVAVRERQLKEQIEKSRAAEALFIRAAEDRDFWFRRLHEMTFEQAALRNSQAELSKAAIEAAMYLKDGTFHAKQIAIRLNAVLIPAHEPEPKL